MTLRTYWFAYNLTNIAAILSRWAPADDTIGSIRGAKSNSPSQYTAFVCGRMRIGPTENLALFYPDKRLNDTANLKALVEAMAEFENGVGFDVPDGEFERALYLVDLDHPPPGDVVAPTAGQPFVTSCAAAEVVPIRDSAAGALDEIRVNDLDVPMVDLGLPEHRALAIDLQRHLIRVGFLEPPADGRFGPLSRHALEEFQKQAGKPLRNAVNAVLAEELLISTEERFF